MTLLTRTDPARPPLSPPSGRSAPARDAAIDHLRIGLTALVILHHTAIVYGGSGGWFWREEPNASNPLLVMFNATNQAYFMGFFFLLAGYYTPPSYERRGAVRFLGERLLRLGLPLVAFFFVLHPLTVALARTSDGQPFWSGWWERILAADWGPGPLWFAEALLLFAAGYAAWRALRPAPARPPNSLPRFTTLAFAAVSLGAISFLVRLAIPVGEEVLWLQLGYFPCYIFLFAAGAAASRSRLLESITFRQAKPWLIVSAVALLTLPIMVLLQPAQGAFEGGWSLNALFYALWDPCVAWGAILGLLWAARRFAARPNPLGTWLSGNAYAAYIVHPPVVVAFSLLAAGPPLPPLLKFVAVGAASCAGSFLAGGILRAIPSARRVL